MKKQKRQVVVLSNGTKIVINQVKAKKKPTLNINLISSLSLIAFVILSIISIRPFQKTSSAFAYNQPYGIQNRVEIVMEQLVDFEEEVIEETSNITAPILLAVEETTKIQEKIEVTVPQEDKFLYNPNIPMPKEHQEYLYQLCKERGLDYVTTLAVLKHESQFDPNSISKTGDYGYMQINKINHKHLSKVLKTSNSPLDPYVNLNWGTYMLQDAYSHWLKVGKTGRELYECALSTYNKGLTGFKKYGKATPYIAKVDTELAYLKSIITK